MQIDRGRERHIKVCEKSESEKTWKKINPSLSPSLVRVISLADRDGTDKVSPPGHSLSYEPHCNVCPERESHQHKLGGGVGGGASGEEVLKHSCQIPSATCRNNTTSTAANK